MVTPDGKPRPPSRGFLLSSCPKFKVERHPLREGVLAITVAEWTRDIALVLSGVAGLLHWEWWYPVLFGAIAALVREASQGFVLIQHCGSGYLLRSITTTCLLCGLVATVAYMLSVI